MSLSNRFPLIFIINLGRRQDRRDLLMARLSEIGIKAERFGAIDASKHFAGKSRLSLAGVRGYESPARYALALTKRLAIREAKRRKAPSVLLLEDDVIFHPNFNDLFSVVELPEDWEIFYLGCAHLEKPEWAGNRLVKVASAVDNHAVAIRASSYDRVLDCLDRHGKSDPDATGASDRFLGKLAASIPTYACYPNLAWQETSRSDLLERTYSHYTADGSQKHNVGAVMDLLDELVDERSAATVKQPKIGLLFLTRNDVHHPDIWREFTGECPAHVRIFSHPKHPLQAGDFLEGTEVAERHPTSWGEISLVRATRALLLEALEDESLTHFALLSESCVPVKPLSEILRRLELDGRSQFGFKNHAKTSKRNRERSKSAPDVPIECWRFQSQWWIMNRAAAIFSGAEDFTRMFEKMFAADESYFATVLSMQGYPLEGEVHNKPSTWCWWKRNAGSPDEWPTVPAEKLREIVTSGAPFARKFPKGSDIGSYGLHRPPMFGGRTDAGR